MKRSNILALILLTLLVGAYFLYNYIEIEKPLVDVIEDDNRNDGIDVSVKYISPINRDEIVFSLDNVNGDKTRLDVFRLFLQYAERLKDNTYSKVHLANKGNNIYSIDGSYFRKLGAEYSAQNPMYTVRTFPENLSRPDGSKAFNSWEGGALGVLSKQMEDFNAFSDQWIAGNAN